MFFWDFSLVSSLQTFFLAVKLAVYYYSLFLSGFFIFILWVLGIILVKNGNSRTSRLFFAFSKAQKVDKEMTNLQIWDKVLYSSTLVFLTTLALLKTFWHLTLGKYSPSPVSLTGFWSYVNATKRMKFYLSALFYTQIYRRSYGKSTVLLFQMVWWRNSAVTTVVTVYKFDTDVDCWLTVKTHCGSIKNWMLLPSPSD